MNTKILLLLAGVLALPACSKNQEIVEADVPTAPLVRRPVTHARPSGPSLPAPPTNVNPGFRTPDPTSKLYDERTSLGPGPAHSQPPREDSATISARPPVNGDTE